MDNSPPSSLSIEESLRYLDFSIDDKEAVKNAFAAKCTLGRWLSVRSVITTTSSNAIQEQEAALDTQLQVFQSIGKGLCGEVFEKVGTGRVYKRELNQNNSGLWNDYKIHTSIYDAIILEKSKPGAASVENFPKLHVPQVYSFITREDNAWWKENGKNFARISSREYTNLLETQLILPLPKLVRKAIITIFCPPKMNKMDVLNDPQNRNCLIRIYLGVRRPFVSQEGNFSLQNFEANLDIIDELGLEKEQHAREMARALAIMHWACKVDANDVEFVLGSAPTDLRLTREEIDQLPAYTPTSRVLNFKKRAVHLWLIDFNNCSEITMDEAGVNKAEDSFWSNDPYYPRPAPPNHQDAALWKSFETSYLKQSAISASHIVKQQGLPEKFINKVVQTAQMRYHSESLGPPAGGLSSSGPPRDGLPLAPRNSSQPYSALTGIPPPLGPPPQMPDYYIPSRNPLSGGPRSYSPTRPPPGTAVGSSRQHYSPTRNSPSGPPNVGPPQFGSSPSTPTPRSASLGHSRGRSGKKHKSREYAPIPQPDFSGGGSSGGASGGDGRQSKG